MFLDRRSAKKAQKGAARRLHAAAVAQGRRPALYAQMGAPDTAEGRFELLTLHVILLIDRLKEEADTRQALFDVYVSDLDGALREMGVGDLAVGKRMRGLGEAFYGRARAYGEAFAVLPERAKLEAVVARTVLDGLDVDPGPLAAYAARVREALAAARTDELLGGRTPWSDPRAPPP